MPRQGWRALAWLCAGCLVLLSLWPRSARALQQTSRVPPEGAIIIAWAGDPSVSRLVDASHPIALDDGEVLLIPIDPGDRVRVVAESGPRPVLGLATGQDELPDVITWDLAASNELLLPAWSSARFVAARASEPALLSVEIVARGETALAWHEWDEQVAAWLRGRASAPALPVGSAAARVARGLEAVVESLTAGERVAAADLLQLAWLEQGARLRPLVGPYFTREPRLEFAEPRSLLAGERYELSAPNIDVLRWQLQAWGNTRVIVREGGGISRDLSWSARPGAPLRASRARSIRVVPPARGGLVSLEVLEGKITFEQRGWIQRADFAEQLRDPLRSRARLLQRAESSSLDWVRAVAASRATRSGDARGLLAYVAAVPPGDLRAWLLLEAARAERQGPAAVALAERAAVEAPSALLQVLALQHRRDVLPAPAARGDQVPALPPLPAGFPPHGTPSEEALWLLALHGQETVAPSSRPSWGAQLERWAALRAEDREVWTSVAGFWRSIPLRSVLPSPGASSSAEYVPLEPGVDCPAPGAPDGSVLTEKFDRWLFPAPGDIPLTAQLPPQHFAPLLFKPLSLEPIAEGSVRLDELSVPVHAAAGLSSEVAVAAGSHVLHVPVGTPPLAVRLSEGLQAPCEQLRRVRTWTELSEGARADFELPGLGALSVARISLAPASLSPVGAGVMTASGAAATPSEGQQELEVRIGRRRLLIWARAARSGASEIRIDPEDGWLALAGRGVAGRARVELRRAADAPPQPVASAPPQPLAQEAGSAAAAPADLDGALESLRQLGRSLRAARGDEGMADLRARRARLLDALGFKELALRDAEPVPAAEREWSWLPGEERSVLPLNLNAKIGPLALPEAVASLVQRRQRLRLGGCGSFAAETEPPRELGADAESLLLGYCAEQNGLLPFAARAYEAIGRAQPNGAALARAASLIADQSLDTATPALAMRARILAANAGALGEDTSGLLARLAPALEWVVPNAYERAAGFSTVTLTAPPIPTLGARVRRALVDAPLDGSLMEGDRAIQIGVRIQEQQQLELELGCDDPADLVCTPELRRDGERFDCAHRPSERSTCVVPLPPGEHQVALRLPSERALGWVKATVAGRVLPLRLSSRWIDVESEEPAQLTVRGPTVVVLEARGTGQATQSIAFESCGDAPIRSFPLPGGADSGALRLDETITLGPPLRVELPVESEGPCTLRLGPTLGRALFRLSVARAQGLPRARFTSIAPSEPPPAAVPPPLAEALVAREPDVVPLEQEPMPLTLFGRSRGLASTRSLDEEGNRQIPSSSYLELSVSAARELIPARFWSTLQAGTRFREGPPSWLSRLSFDLPPTSNAPGMHLEGAAYGQTQASEHNISWRTTGTLSAVARLSPYLSVMPRASYTLDYEPWQPEDLSVTDPDVYSPYRESHPRYLDLALVTNWRPLVDGLGKLTLSARALPDFEGLDRTGAEASWIFLPFGSLNALVDLGLESSLRPDGPSRSRAFVRQSASLGASYWSWISDGERLRIFARVGGSFDAPSGELGPVYTGELGVEFLVSATRGLRDLSPATLPFLDFQERGRSQAPTAFTPEAEQ
ncbi:MAG: hypothetical protein RL033_728 [Pseudomonadota bacterium]